jgi:hypothetical protein
MAHLTETLDLQRGLLRHLQDRPTITLLDNTKVENTSKMTLQVEAGQRSSSPTGQPYGLDFWCVPPGYETLRDS